jgi:hypothetical protein
VAEPDGVPQEAWIRLGAVQEIVRTPHAVGADFEFREGDCNAIRI